MATDRRRPPAGGASTVVGLVRACHLQPTLAVTTVTTALAALAGRGTAGCVAVAVAVLAGQLSTGWSNDWFDAARDRATDRRDKPIVSGSVDTGVVRFAACAALAAAVPLSLLSGWQAATVHLVAIASAWAYNLGIKATVASPLPYGLSFGLLPAFVTLGLPGHPWPRPSIMAGTALLGIGAHFVNTLADRDADARTGINGLPQRIPAQAALLIGVALLASCAVVIWFLGGSAVVVRTALLVAALGAAGMVVVTTVRSRPRAAWSWTLATLLPSLAMFAVARPHLVAH